MKLHGKNFSNLYLSTALLHLPKLLVLLFITQCMFAFKLLRIFQFIMSLLIISKKSFLIFFFHKRFFCTWQHGKTHARQSCSVRSAGPWHGKLDNPNDVSILSKHPNTGGHPLYLLVISNSIPICTRKINCVQHLISFKIVLILCTVWWNKQVFHTMKLLHNTAQ